MIDFARRWLTAYHASDAAHRRLRHGLRLAQDLLTTTVAGRNLILLLFVLGISGGLILARAGPDQQGTYYYGLLSVQLLMCAYSFHIVKPRHRLWLLIVLLALVYSALGAADRLVRVSQHDRAIHSSFNIHLYDSINDVTGWIASDWNGDSPITVSYDMLPEVPHLWWVAPWHTIDESYGIGMAYDYLLGSYYGLDNSNRNPAGLAERPDYIVTSAPGLQRYALEDYQVHRFGALYVLKPQRQA